MSTKTKASSVFFTVVLAGVVLVAFSLFGNPLKPREGNDEAREVTFTATWLPSPREGRSAVDIWLTVNGKQIGSAPFNTAPFSRTFPAKKGQRAEIRMTLSGPAVSTFMGCSIAVNGVEVVNEHLDQQLKTGQTLVCWTAV